ncbi:MAG: tRNA (N(6)-L-threonylcarbamoyladenosine(37)-C(2))-methylthiotransferase MtaB [Erysipelotrichia bacterium]|nr:tRNA (N(6)-L-threonylcarbamoyladenosine(37)-C(2))-methylthiotransferase MtaB [Erysipelotrichia bacterium]
MKFKVVNLGCKVNAYEAESVAALMEQNGFVRAIGTEKADAVLIFTCAVTNTAAQKSRQMMHRARRENPDAVIAAIGCYAEIDPGALSDADVLVGSANKNRIPEYISSYMKSHEKYSEIADLKHPIPFETLHMDHFEDQTRAYLKIQDGCNQFCSYCIIPYARGRERSMNPEEAVKEAVRLSQSHHEIVLAGIHTGRYGREYNVSLGELMQRMLNAAPSLQRLRISSIEMTELDQNFLNLYANEPRIARHLHIPLQSGSDTVLARMNRPYDTEAYYDKIMTIREQAEDTSVSADVIVGFPGETDAEFEEALSFIRHCHLSFLHVFPYSMRQGTKAADMPQQIPAEVKKMRTRKMMDLSEELYGEYLDQWIGRTASVLIESVQKIQYPV